MKGEFTLIALWVVSVMASLNPIAMGQDWPRMLGPNDDSIVASSAINFTNDQPLKFVWQLHVGEGYGNVVIASDRMFHFDRYGSQERLTCYEPKTGIEKWKLEFPVFYQDSFGYNNGPRAMPVANDKYVIAFGAAGRLIVADAATGSLVWQKETMREYNVLPNFFGVGSTPCIYKDTLIVMIGGSPAADASINLGRLKDRSGDGSAIVAFDLATGKELYRTGPYLASYSAPMIRSIDGRDWGA
jgi:outer membrane protein assembly factor BamB